MWHPQRSLQIAKPVAHEDLDLLELEDGADAAIEALNGQDYKGRALRVNEAQSKERSGGGRPGGGGGRRF